MRAAVIVLSFLLVVSALLNVGLALKAYGWYMERQYYQEHIEMFCKR